MEPQELTLEDLGRLVELNTGRISLLLGYNPKTPKYPFETFYYYFGHDGKAYGDVFVARFLTERVVISSS